MTEVDLDLVPGDDLSLPEPIGRGRRSAEHREAYEARVRNWCRGLISFKEQIDATQPDLHLGTRDWCYLLQNHGLHKEDFDNAEKLITKCRKKAWLPLDIVSEDESRAATNIDHLDADDPEWDAEYWVDRILRAHLEYHPVSFWDYQDNYVEIGVEKMSVHSLFDPVCNRYHVPIFPLRGSWDLHSRARLLRRVAFQQDRGKHCVLGSCCDHDVGGLRISGALKNNLREMALQMEREGVDVDIEEIEVVRFGLHVDWINRHRLPWIDGLSTGGTDTPNLEDPEHTKHWEHDVQDYLRRFGARKVETNALVQVPEAAAALCEEFILGYVDPTRIERFKRAERREQKKVADAIKRMLRARWSR